MALDATEHSMHDRLKAQQSQMLLRVGEMVSMPTGYGNKSGLLSLREFLAVRLRNLGATIELIDADARPEWIESTSGPDARMPILVAHRTQGRTGPRMLLCGHLDTVHDPKGTFQRMEPRSDGAVVGPGVVDMKGGLEVLVCALEMLEAHGERVAWTVVLVSDEESGSFGSAAALTKLAATHDRAFVVEPATASGDLVVARAGSGQFMLQAFGRAAHAGRDFAKGISAVTALAKAVVDASALVDIPRGRLVNIGPLQGGVATNIVPDAARAWGNFRFANDAEGRELGLALDALAYGSESDVPRLRLCKNANRPAKPCTDQVKALGLRAQIVATDLGLSVGLASTGGVSDANLIQQAGPPTLDGLGVRGGNLHRNDEFMWPDSLPERASLLAILLRRESRLSTE